MLPPGLYVVATPIGNMADLSPRAEDVLRRSSKILCEDTRKTGILLGHYGIRNSLISYHKFNEQKKLRVIVDQLLQGESLALVCDNGTPAISDPGNRLLRACHHNSVTVHCLPGCCAISAAVSVSGLGEHGYCFIGFLPTKTGARTALLKRYSNLPNALVCFESPHRIIETVDDFVSVFGGSRQVCFVRELSKRFETIILLSLVDLRTLLERDVNQLRGEIVLVLAPVEKDKVSIECTDDIVLMEALTKAGVATRPASQVLASITGKSKRDCYHAYLNHLSI